MKRNSKNENINNENLKNENIQNNIFNAQYNIFNNVEYFFLYDDNNDFNFETKMKKKFILYLTFRIISISIL